MSNRSYPNKMFFKTFEAECGSRNDLCPIIFIHGMFTTINTWTYIAQVVANKTRRKVHTYDARNHGGSFTSDDFSFELNVDDLSYFMDMLNISKAILVGHSMGGFTANRFALRMPQRTEMVFIEEIHVKNIPQGVVDSLKQICEGTMEVAQSIPKDCDDLEVMQLAQTLMLEKIPVLSQGMARKNPSFSNFFKRTFDGTYCTTFNAPAILKALNQPEKLLPDAQNQYEGPSFFIYSEKSPIQVGSHEEHILKHFPNAEFIVFEGDSHDIHGAYPEKFLQIMLDRIPH